MTASSQTLLFILIGLGISGVISAVISIYLEPKTKSQSLADRFVPSKEWRSQWFQGFSTEMFGALVATILLTVILGQVQQEVQNTENNRALKEQLIFQMGSPNHDMAIEAVRQLRAKNWITDGSLEKGDFEGANLETAELEGAHLNNANFQSAILRGTKLQQADLSQAKLMQADLENANLEGANLDGAELSQANLMGVSFKNASLIGADLQDTKLDTLTLEHADLSFANLTHKNLVGLSLEGTILIGANLQEALIDSDLRGKDLTGVNLKDADVSNAFFDSTTILPDGKMWTSSTDMERFTNPANPRFWRSDDPNSPAYDGAS